MHFDPTQPTYDADCFGTEDSGQGTGIELILDLWIFGSWIFDLGSLIFLISDALAHGDCRSICEDNRPVGLDPYKYLVM